MKSDRQMLKKSGLLLINLGTPDSPEPTDVGRYLKQFLMDPLVIDLPTLLRWILVNVIIVPRRAKASSVLYKKVWEKAGSPLMFHSRALVDRVQELIPKTPVALGMRYANPSIASALASLREQGVTDVVVFPLYPQFSLSSTESSVVEVKKHLGDMRAVYVPPFYRSEAYLDAVAEVSRPYFKKSHYDLVLFSFHGLPESQIQKVAPKNSGCLVAADCCETARIENKDCYRHQCYATAKSITQKLGLNPLRTTVAFQSRLTRRWIRPFTDDFYRTLPSQGVKKIAVICPSFVADCLETLEEVAIRGKEEFVASGGQALDLIPSLNSSGVWAEAVLRIAAESAPELIPHRSATPDSLVGSTDKTTSPSVESSYAGRKPRGTSPNPKSAE